MSFRIFFELKYEFLSLNTSHVSQVHVWMLRKDLTYINYTQTYYTIIHRTIIASCFWATAEHDVNKGKGKVFYGQEPPSGESTTTECTVNYQLLAVITEVAQWGPPSCSQPQPATDN